jgi:hypothetical protein
MGDLWPSIPDSCASCVEQSCCAEAKACGDNAECLAYRQCVAACATNDDACFTKCATDHSAGKTPSSTFSTCREAKCSISCDNLACVGKVTWNTPSDASYPLKVTFYELQSGSSLKDLTVKVCATSDTTCSSPLSQGTTDAQGLVSLTVPSAVEGLGAYFEVTGTDIMPTLAHLNFTDNVKSFKAGAFVSPVMSKSTASLLAGVISVTLDSTRGNILFQTKDCSDYAFASASVSVDIADAQSTTTYIKGTMPSKTETVTDPTGRGAVLNVPAGTAVVTGSLEPAKSTFSKFTVLTRAGYMTTMNVVPTPGL